MGDFLKRHTTACVVAFFIVLFGACGLYIWQTLKPQPPAEIGQIEAPADNADSSTDSNDTTTTTEPANTNWKQLVSDYNGRDNLVVTKDDKIIDTDPAVESKFTEGIQALAKVTESDFGENAQAVANKYFFGYVQTAAQVRQYVGIGADVEVSDFVMYHTPDEGTAPLRFTAKIRSKKSGYTLYVDGYYDAQAQQFKISDVVPSE
jgi:lipoprotein